MNVAGCVDLRLEPRRRFIHGIESGMRIFDWLSVNRWDLLSCTLTAASNPATPITAQQTGRTARWFFGAVREVQGRAAAVDSDESWLTGDLFSDVDGEFYLGFASRDDGACCAVVDPLGLFPLYYASTPEFFLFASSMWPFGQHPDLSAQLDVDGLIGVLLTQGLVGGRTLRLGVRRLRPGHAVTWQPGRVATERRVHRWRPTTDLFHVSEADQLDSLDAALRAAVASAEGDALLLSGGLDSRLIAGYVSELRDRPVDAISLGSPWQYDVAFAREVANQLGWTHQALEVDHGLFPQHARLQVRHEQLSGMFSDLAFWQLVVDAHARAPTILTGFCGNNVLEPLRHDPGQTEWSFQRMFAACNKYGVSPDVLPTLLRVDHVDERIESVIDCLRDEFEEPGGEPFQQVLLFDLSHRARFLIGSVVWRTSFGVRPLLPYADRRVVETALSLPLSAFEGRQLQRMLLCRRFPNLARLPMDTATFFTRPVLPSLRTRLRHLGLLAVHGLFSRRERRYYHSVFDLNGAGWRAVRLEAEAGRARAESVFDSAALKQLVPPPDQDIRTGSSQFFHAGSRTKGLLAFMMWASECL